MHQGIVQRYAELLPQTPEEMAAAIFCEKDIKKLFEQIVFNRRMTTQKSSFCWKKTAGWSVCGSYISS